METDLKKVKIDKHLLTLLNKIQYHLYGKTIVEISTGRKPDEI